VRGASGEETRVSVEGRLARETDHDLAAHVDVFVIVPLDTPEPRCRDPRNTGRRIELRIRFFADRGGAVTPTKSIGAHLKKRKSQRRRLGPALGWESACGFRRPTELRTSENQGPDVARRFRPRTANCVARYSGPRDRRPREPGAAPLQEEVAGRNLTCARMRFRPEISVICAGGGERGSEET
jgi:hypothetical protein